MNPERILRELDSRLSRPTRLILYGRAALALGYPSSGEFTSTHDVDVILPEIEMGAIEADDQFWNAVEATNRALEAEGLYITHLFTDSQIILSPDWLEHIEAIPLAGMGNLALFRPRTEDLILTKMMRVDPQDRSDIRFLLARGGLAPQRIAALAAAARVPEIPEIREAFSANLEWLLEKS